MKVGQLVEIKDDLHFRGFEKGEIVRIIGFINNSFICRNKKGLIQYLNIDEVKEFEEKITIKEFAGLNGINVEDVSDGYHDFKTLYDFRKLYNAALFNEWAKFDIPQYNVHKSWKHNDGELCFGGGWFIVVAILPSGQISNHYEAKDWDLFKIPSKETALFPFDGHTANDVLERLKAL